MHLEFVYTVEDLEESAKAVARTQRASWGFAAPRSGQLAGWVLFIGLAVMLYFLLRHSAVQPAAAPGTPPAPVVAPPRDVVGQFLLPFVPWLLIFGFIWFFVFRHLRNASRNAMRDTPSLQQVQSLDVGDDGIRLSTPLAATHWRWLNFNGLEETTNLLLLRLTDGTHLMIPKRAAADAGQLEQLSRMLRSHVSEHTGAFPVLPASPQE